MGGYALLQKEIRRRELAFERELVAYPELYQAFQDICVIYKALDVFKKNRNCRPTRRFARPLTDEIREAIKLQNGPFRSRGILANLIKANPARFSLSDRQRVSATISNMTQNGELVAQRTARGTWYQLKTSATGESTQPSQEANNGE